MEHSILYTVAKAP